MSTTFRWVGLGYRILNTPLMSCGALAEQLGREELVIVDCRFDLARPAAGRDAWLEAHIPGAVYAHLESDLSGPPTTDRGRHPLPPGARLCEVFSALGIDESVTVVAYDDCGGMIASRLWWMLRYAGHPAVRVLDGAWQSWVAQGLPVRVGVETNPLRRFLARPRAERLVRMADIDAQCQLLDAREPGRFSGEFEPIDPVAGHIPGARNHWWKRNLDANGCFLPPAQLRTMLSASLQRQPDAQTVHYCGSGVSACHNILAQCIAELPEPRLYCGSWSEWCQPDRPGAIIPPCSG